ncbi:MAG: cytochrome c-type biogenesis protein CcmH [Nitrospinae bacterium]|nr:cytochrome c-type biogenesis protein CcmH [Nitrospinota bacterium]
MKTVIYTIMAAALAAMAGFAHAADGQAADELFDTLSKEMMCLCSCNQTIKNCPHVNCDFAVPARLEIKKQISEGKGHDQIIAAFIGKHGQVILAQPKKEGFNVVGYVFPFVAIVAVGGGVAALVREWAGRGAGKKAPEQGAGQGGKPPVEGGDSDLVERMKKELSDFDA